jgi:hypothetical protein
MREIVKKFVHTIEEKEETFQVRKMNALQGSFLLKFVAEKIIPLIDSFETIFVAGNEEIDSPEKAEEMAKKRTETIIEVIPKALASISQEELYNFEKQCLNTVDMMKPAGWQKVMSGDDFCVEEVEYDPILALMLCFDVIQFNFSGFFGGGALSSLLPRPNTSK